MANKRKYHYYVLVFGLNGPAYVTSVKYADKTAFWNKNEKPVEMDETRANDLCLGLCLNGHSAVVVKMPYEVENQPYLCKFGGFEWVEKTENEKTDEE